MKNYTLIILMLLQGFTGFSQEPNSLKNYTSDPQMLMLQDITNINKMVRNKEFNEAQILIDNIKNKVKNPEEKGNNNIWMYYAMAYALEQDIIYKKNKDLKASIQLTKQTLDEYVKYEGSYPGGDDVFFATISNHIQRYKPYNEDANLVKDTYQYILSLLNKNSWMKPTIEREIAYINKKVLAKKSDSKSTIKPSGAQNTSVQNIIKQTEYKNDKAFIKDLMTKGAKELELAKDKMYDKNYTEAITILEGVRSRVKKIKKNDNYWNYYNKACKIQLEIYKEQNDLESALKFTKKTIDDLIEHKGENTNVADQFFTNLYYNLRAFKPYSNINELRTLLIYMIEKMKQDFPVKQQIIWEIEKIDKQLNTKQHKAITEFYKRNKKGDILKIPGYESIADESEIYEDAINVKEIQEKMNKIKEVASKLGEELSNAVFDNLQTSDFNMEGIDSLVASKVNPEDLKKYEDFKSTMDVVNKFQDATFGGKEMEQISTVGEADEYTIATMNYLVNSQNEDHQANITVAKQMYKFAANKEQKSFSRYLEAMAYFSNKDFINAELIFQSLTKELPIGDYLRSSYTMLIESLISNKKYTEATKVYEKIKPDFFKSDESGKEDAFKEKVNSDYTIKDNDRIIASGIPLAYQKVGNNKKGDAALNEVINYLNESLVELALYGESINSKYNFTESTDIVFFYLMNRKIKSDEIVAKSYENILVSKSILLNTTKTINAYFTENLDPKLKKKFKEVSELRAKYIGDSNTQDEDAIIYTKKKEYYLVAQQGKQIAKAFKESQVSWENVKSALLEDEAAVEFVTFSDPYNYNSNKPIYYGAFVLKKTEQFPTYVQLCEKKELEVLLAPLSKSSQSLSAQINNLYTKKGRQLYDLIWKKIISEIGEQKTIYFSPTGDLHNIAHQALPYRNQSETLGTAFKLIQLSSTKQIVNPKLVSDYKRAILFGDVAYNTAIEQPNNATSKIKSDNSRGSSFGNLTGTKKEIEYISSILNNNGLQHLKYTGNEATEENFNNIINTNPDIIHIATHAFYLKPTTETPFFMSDLEGLSKFKGNEDPMFRSGLALTGANYYWRYGKTISKNTKDGILTAKELSECNLKNVDLIVLSACETGIGQSVGNEGVYGLQRGVKKAGVKNMLLSLWKVDDSKTQEYMNLFYQNLIDKKLDIQTAYYNTQKAFKERHPQPYYWGAFVLIQ